MTLEIFLSKCYGLKTMSLIDKQTGNRLFIGNMKEELHINEWLSKKIDSFYVAKNNSVIIELV